MMGTVIVVFWMCAMVAVMFAPIFFSFVDYVQDKKREERVNELRSLLGKRVCARRRDKGFRFGIVGIVKYICYENDSVFVEDERHENELYIFYRKNVFEIEMSGDCAAERQEEKNEKEN